MRVDFFKLGGVVFFVMGVILSASAQAQETFGEYCSKRYKESSQCPGTLCSLECLKGTEETPENECPKVCVPRDCKEISVENCPQSFCLIQTDCSKITTCQSLVDPDQIPECGGLAYSGQDVDCCKGLVKRCGFDYLDGKCNMQGKNTAYYLPICIPCGDGVCTNFENHCNCPEDCKKEIIDLD